MHMIMKIPKSHEMNNNVCVSREGGTLYDISARIIGCLSYISLYTVKTESQNGKTCVRYMKTMHVTNTYTCIYGIIKTVTWLAQPQWDVVMNCQDFMTGNV